MLVVSFSISAQTNGYTYLLEPEFIASKDGNMAHMELMIAANPADQGNFLVGAITSAKPSGGFACKTYATLDDGNTWSEASFTEQMENGGADPQVYFGKNGKAYFAALSSVTRSDGRPGTGLFFYTSEDGGKSWSVGKSLGASYDHPQLVVDHTESKFAGNIYIGVLYSEIMGPKLDYKLGLFISEDEGVTFEGPVEFASGKGEIGINVTNLLVLSDGTLFIPFPDFEYIPPKREQNPNSSTWFVLSNDGGRTFTEPQKINTQISKNINPQLNTMPVFAVDNKPGKYRDRIYMVFGDERTGNCRIFFTYTSDRGESWSEPKLIDNNAPDASIQYQQMIFVNNQGVVGITWYDTRDVVSVRGYNQYFIASVDGGASFLSPIKISGEESKPLGSGNLNYQVFANSFRSTDTLFMGMISPMSRWPQGGDYMGLTADADGYFHPAWADSRTGTYQIYTRKIKVVEKSELLLGNKTNISHIATSVITDKIDLITDQTNFNAATSEAKISIRLKNKSKENIYTPIRVKITDFGSGPAKAFKEFAPVILNASNAESGINAEFDYSDKLGSDNILIPGELSGASIWKMKMSDPVQVPYFHITVEGIIEESRQQ